MVCAASRRQLQNCVFLVGWDAVGKAEARTANLDPEIETLHLGWPSYPTNRGFSTYGLLYEREIVSYSLRLYAQKPFCIATSTVPLTNLPIFPHLSKRYLHPPNFLSQKHN